MTAPLALADLLERLALYADAWAVIVVDDAPEVEADVKLARARAALLRENGEAMFAVCPIGCPIAPGGWAVEVVVCWQCDRRLIPLYALAEPEVP